MAFSMIRVKSWRNRIEDRLNDVLINYLSHQNSRSQLPLSLLPLVTIFRESLEAFILIAGVIVYLIY
jgi:high-affinity Fe2+/Pb2+ permease